MNPSQGKERRRRKSKKAKSGAQGKGVAKPKRGRKAKAPAPPPSTPSAGALMVQGVTTTLPLLWFLEPLRQAMRTPVRPPTANTRRRQRVVELQVPIEVFHHLIRGFKTGELAGLRWTQDSPPALHPTRETPLFKEYKYDVRQPAQLNTLWELQQWDRPVAGTPWRRGWGAQRLQISQAAGQRGRTTMLLSSVCGNVSLRLRQPPHRMPTLQIVFAVMTLDAANHILWNQTYAPNTRGALCRMATAGLQGMAADPLYPTPAAATVAAAVAAPPQEEVWRAAEEQQAAAQVQTGGND